ncbi:MAG TPA: DUF1684 domain-containing protein [Thermoanaerobaculia bacterium]|nr:DUF1684 domain-containing protein [Thermoanaerobaculia bacterium]
MLLFLALLWLGAPSSPVKDEVARYRAEIEKWRADRIGRLTADDGWLSVVGLFWLEEGENSLGSAESNRIVLPSGRVPARLGTVRLARGRATLTVAPGGDVTHEGKPVTTIDLASDADGEPTVLRLGTITFYLIRRGERLGMRIKDSAAAARKTFHGIDGYPIDRKWRVPARFVVYRPKRTIPIPNVLGGVTQEPSPGAVVFSIDGTEHRLDAVEEQGEEDLFLIFGDRTNGTETYGAGRFLYAPRPGPDGKTFVDFNKAYNPPCAFTAYATCPLPPPQNRLTIAVTAGEKRYGRH